MDIQEFVKDSIRQILNATSELNSEFKEQGVKVAAATCIKGINSSRSYSNKIINIEFNISVTVDESTGKKGSAGVKVLPILNGSGELESIKGSQISNTIHFDIPVTMPMIR